MSASAPQHDPPPDPRELLAEYRALIAASRVGWFVLLPFGRGRLSRIRLRPRMGFLARFFTVQHVRRSVAELGRQYQLGTALHPGESAYEDGAKQVEAFGKFIPAHRPRVALVALLVAIMGLAFLLAKYVADDIDPTLNALFDAEGEGALTMATSAEPLRKMTGASLTLNPGDFAEGLSSLACVESGKESVCSLKRGLTSGVASLILIAVSIWLIMLVPNSAFRLKRTLFNLGSARANELRAHPAAEFGTRADGVYRLEREFFARLGAAPPRELPVDLASQGALVVVPIWLGVLSALYASYAIWVFRSELVVSDWQVISALYFGTLFAIGLGVARLASLRRCYDGRNPEEGDRSAEPERPKARRRARVAAFVVDAVLVVALALLLSRVANWAIADREVREVVFLFVLGPLAWLAYDAVALLALRGVSVGKLMFGLEVVRSSSGAPLSPLRLLARDCLAKGFFFGPAASAPALYLGGFHQEFLRALVVASALGVLLDYLWPLWGTRGRTLHDFVFDTVVVRRVPSPKAMPAPAPV